jgi:hypothetical protein
LAEVAAAVAAGRAADPRKAAFDDDSGDLRQHVASCAACADLVLVMSSLGAERERARRNVSVPSAGLVWWRAQLRQRQAAARAAAAPVAFVQVVATVVVIGFVGFVAWTLSGSVGVPDLAALLPALPAWVTAPTQEAGSSLSLLRSAAALTAAASLILVPVALYFALRSD